MKSENPLSLNLGRYLLISFRCPLLLLLQKNRLATAATNYWATAMFVFNSWIFKSCYVCFNGCYMQIRCCYGGSNNWPPFFSYCYDSRRGCYMAYFIKICPSSLAPAVPIIYLYRCSIFIINVSWCYARNKTPSPPHRLSEPGWTGIKGIKKDFWCGNTPGR